MTTRSRISLCALILPAALAGCGSSGGSYGGGGAGRSPAAATPVAAITPAGAAALTTRTTSLGRVIVDSSGRTLYAFGHDKKNVSRCGGPCATNWPPALIGGKAKPKVAGGLAKGKLRVIHRAGGKRQLAFAGHPLYRFVADARPGDVKGQGVNAFGGVWHVVARSGSPVTGAPKSQSQSAPASPAAPSGGYSGGGY
jgi:predicted lipoprotein with Yx(FWY)xxD motif